MACTVREALRRWAGFSLGSANPCRQLTHHPGGTSSPKVTSHQSDQRSTTPFCQRTAWCDRLVPDAHGPQSACDGAAIDPFLQNLLQALPNLTSQNASSYTANG